MLIDTSSLILLEVEPLTTSEVVEQLLKEMVSSVAGTAVSEVVVLSDDDGAKECSAERNPAADIVHKDSPTQTEEASTDKSQVTSIEEGPVSCSIPAIG